MNVEPQLRGSQGWLALTIICTLLLALGIYVMMRSQSGNSAGSALIKIDSNGTTRIGPVPLRNTNFRDAAFTAVSYLNQGTVSVSASGSAKMSDFVKTLDAMQRAGMTSLTFRATSAAGSAKISDLVKTQYMLRRGITSTFRTETPSNDSLTLTDK